MESIPINLESKPTPKVLGAAWSHLLDSLIIAKLAKLGSVRAQTYHKLERMTRNSWYSQPLALNMRLQGQRLYLGDYFLEFTV